MRVGLYNLICAVVRCIVMYDDVCTYICTLSFDAPKHIGYSSIASSIANHRISRRHQWPWLPRIHGILIDRLPER